MDQSWFILLLHPGYFHVDPGRVRLDLPHYPRSTLVGLPGQGYFFWHPFTVRLDQAITWDISGKGVLHTSYGAPWCSFKSLSECPSNVSSAGEQKRFLVQGFLLAGVTPPVYKTIQVIELSTCDHHSQTLSRLWFGLYP